MKDVEISNRSETLTSLLRNEATVARLWIIPDKDFTFAGMDDLLGYLRKTISVATVVTITAPGSLEFTGPDKTILISSNSGYEPGIKIEGSELNTDSRKFLIKGNVISGFVRGLVTYYSTAHNTPANNVGTFLRETGDFWIGTIADDGNSHLSYLKAKNSLAIGSSLGNIGDYDFIQGTNVVNNGTGTHNILKGNAFIIKGVSKGNIIMGEAFIDNGTTSQSNLQFNLLLAGAAATEYRNIAGTIVVGDDVKVNTILNDYQTLYGLMMGNHNTADNSHHMFQFGTGLVTSYNDADHGLWKFQPKFYFGNTNVHMGVVKAAWVIANGYFGSYHSNSLTHLTNGWTQINTINSGFEGGVGPDTDLSTADVTPKAALDVVSINSGVLVPRLTTAQFGAMPSGNKVDGLILYEETIDKFKFYQGGSFVELGGGAGVSSVSGTTDRITSTGGATPVIDISSAYAGQNTITIVGTIATGTWSATAIAADKGGTGQTVYAVGDILYASTTTALSKLADIATGNALISGGVNTAPSWGKIALTTHVSGTLPIANGGTNLTTYTTGDLIQATASNTLSALASVSAGSYLRSAGTSTANVWSTLKLPNSATANRVAYATATNTWGESANFTFDGNQMVVIGSGNDQIIISGTGSGRSGLQVQNTSSAGQSTIYMQNDRLSFLSYGGFYVGGSTVSGTFFGVNKADHLFMFADGANTSGMTIGTMTADDFDIGTNNVIRLKITSVGSLNLERTVTAAGTTGAQTIDKMSGIVNIAAGQTTLVVTCARATTTSSIWTQVLGVDTVTKYCTVTRASGSFTITLNAAAVAEIAICFLVTN